MIFRWHVTLFSPETHFFLAFPVLPRASGTSSKDLTLYFPRKYFSDSAFSFLHPLLHLLFPLISFPLFIHPSLFAPSPLSFSFLPTFPSSSPINERSRAPSRTTRVRVRLHLPTRQAVFVFILHRFTHLPQSTVYQCVRCEEKTRKSLHKTHNHLKINILPQTSDFIHCEFHLSPR